MTLFIHIDQGKLAACFDLDAFLMSMTGPIKEICQSFENRNQHAHNGKITLGNRNMFRPHLCSGFPFDFINFYPLLAILSNSSETVRTKGMTGEVLLSQEDNEAEFKVFILLWKFQDLLPPIFTPTN